MRVGGAGRTPSPLYYAARVRSVVPQSPHPCLSVTRTGLRTTLSTKNPMTTPKPPDIFDDGGLCTRCGHEVESHGQSIGEDNVLRVFCGACPLHLIRLMGDEGTETPIPFFIEFRAGTPDPCYGRRAAGRAENILPRSPGPHADHQLTLSAPGDDGITFTGTAWRADEVDNLQHGDDVGRNLVYKLQLYWNQEGMCPGCRRRIHFDIKEMDRLVAGADGGEYTVGNVQLLCPACNKLKGSKDMAHLAARRREQGLLDT